MIILSRGDNSPRPLETGRFIQKPHGGALKKRANATPGENNKIAFSSTKAENAMFIRKICDNLINMREASFAKSLLAAIVKISPDVTTRTKSNVLLIESP